MSREIPAVFESGVFQPLEPMDLAQGTRLVVQVQAPATSADEVVDESTRLAWSEYLDRMESLPDNSPQDELSGRDHDRILYGG